METILIPILIKILLLILCVSVISLTIKLNRLFNKKNIEIEQELLARVVGVAVSWVEQEHFNDVNTNKYSLVYKYVEDKLDVWGCKIEPEDIQKVIEATLNTFKRLKGKK